MAGELTGGVLSGCDPGGYYCEMTGGGGGTAAHTAPIRSRLADLLIGDLRRRARDAERELFSLGITFTLYSQNHAIDRILPFDGIQMCLNSVSDEMPYAFFGVPRPASVAVARSQARTGA